MIKKIQYWIEQVPWYVFISLVIYFIGKAYFHSDNSSLIIISTIGATCFTYLAIHNLFNNRRL